MTLRTRATSLFLFVAFAATFLFLSAPAEGDATSDRAEAAAVKKGKELWAKAFRRGAKSCRACHTRGPNKMSGERLKEYPKYDKTLKKVVTAQQKLNQMIKKKGGGKPLELGSDDLNALEAYISTLP